MEFNSGKWYIYKKYWPDIYVPLCWDKYVLEFDTEESAKDFVAKSVTEMLFEDTDITYDQIAYFSVNTETMNATFYRVRAGFGGIKHYLYDTRKEN